MMKHRIKILLATIFGIALLCYGANVISNPGFETAGGGGADVFANWTEGTAGTSSVNDETGDVHEDSHACRLDIDASNNSASLYNTFALSIGETYELSIWYKNSEAAKTMRFYLYNNMSNIWLKDDSTWASGVPTAVTLPNSTSWTEYTITFTVSSYTDYVLNMNNNSAASSSIYIDDVSLDTFNPHNTVLKSGTKLILGTGLKVIIK